MEQSSKPVTIDNDTAPQQPKDERSKTNKSSVKGSSDKIFDIAQQYLLDYQLKSEHDSAMNEFQRFQARFRLREETRQKNLETIMNYAYRACHDEVAGNPDSDWLTRYFDMAQDISNPSMQKLWAQVLKNEILSPGSISVKSLKVLQDLSPKEAQTLQRAASLSSTFGGDSAKKLILGYKQKATLFRLGKPTQHGVFNLGAFQLPYSSLLLLIDLGIILGTELESGEIEAEPPLLISYQSKSIALEPLHRGLRLAYYRFTPVGNELCRLLGNKPNMKYYDHLIATLNQQFVVTSEIKSTMQTSA